MKKRRKRKKEGKSRHQKKEGKRKVEGMVGVELGKKMIKKMIRKMIRKRQQKRMKRKIRMTRVRKAVMEEADCLTRMKELKTTNSSNHDAIQSNYDIKGWDNCLDKLSSPYAYEGQREKKGPSNNDPNFVFMLSICVLIFK